MNPTDVRDWAIAVIACVIALIVVVLGFILIRAALADEDETPKDGTKHLFHGP